MARTTGAFNPIRSPSFHFSVPLSAKRVLSVLVFLHISPLHWKLTLPLLYSSLAVSTACPRLSPRIWWQSWKATYICFTPNNFPLILHPLSYCSYWHRVSWYYSLDTIIASSQKKVHNLRAFYPTLHCSFRFSSIAENSLLMRPVGVWAMWQS